MAPNTISPSELGSTRTAGWPQRQRPLILFLAIATSVSLACPRPEFPRQQLLENVVEGQVLPVNEEFVERCQRLHSALAKLQEDASPAALSRAQNAWIAASSTWQSARLFRFDRMMVIHDQVSKRPADTSFIESVIADTATPITSHRIESFGSLSKGLGAIEYLLFGAEGEQAADQLTREPDRVEYLLAASESLVVAAERVRDTWVDADRGYSQTFLHEHGDTDTFRRSLGLLVNRMAAELETLIRDHLGRPLGRGAHTARPETVLAPRSATSLMIVKLRLAAIEQAFTGESYTSNLTGSNEPAGIKQYLDHLDAKYDNRPLSEVLVEQFERSSAALESVAKPLRKAVVTDAQRVADANEELRKLLVLIKVDMANQLGVTITFNDNDGD